MAVKKMKQLGIDWFYVLDDISRAGMSLQKIAKAIDVPRTTIIGWKQGAEPRYDAGDRLLGLWRHKTGKSNADVEIVRIPTAHHL